jgi:Integrase zinc binding domain
MSIDNTTARHVLHKLQCWALKLSVFSYRIEHVAGEFSYWMDLMTRWGVGWIAGSESKARSKLASPFAQPYFSPPDDDRPEFPAKQEILWAQKNAVAEYNRRKQAIANGEKIVALNEEPPVNIGSRGLRMIDGAIWVPEKAVDLQLRMCVETHFEAGGHRGFQATYGAVNTYVQWINMAKDIKVFVQICLHCVASASGERLLTHWVHKFTRESRTS